MSGDVQFAQVQLLLNFEGADLSTAIVDTGPLARTVTLGGGVKITTTSPLLDTSSGLFNGGSGAYLQIDGALIGSGDFCIEGFLSLTISGTMVIVDNRSAQIKDFLLFISAGAINLLAGGATRATSSAIATGTKYHWAVDRKAGVTRCFLGGVQFGADYADSNDYSSARWRIGTTHSSTLGFNGRQDGVRFTAASRYRTAFTPPTEMPEFAGTPTGVGTGYYGTAFGSHHGAESFADKGFGTGYYGTVSGVGRLSHLKGVGYYGTASGFGHGAVPVPVLFEWAAPFQHLVGVEFASSHAIGGLIGLDFDSLFSIGPPYPMVGAEFATPMLGLIELEFGATNRLQDSLRLELIVAQSLTAQVRREFLASHAIENIDSIGMELVVPYTYLSTGLLEQDSITFLQGVDFTAELEEVELSCDEGSAVWEATCTLQNVGDILKFKVNDSFSVVLEGETFNFIVDSRGVDRSAPDQPKATIYGRSPMVRYQEPRAAKLSKTWATAVAASAIAQELIPGIVWGVVDWIVPAGNFGVTNSNPYQAVARLAEAAGAIVESLPDGTIQVRYLHPVSVPHYSDATASHVLSDMEDNFTSLERYSPNVLVDLIAIGDEQAEQANDRVEFEQDEATPESGVIRVYPSVWRDNVQARATGPLSIAPTGVKSRSETQVIEFKEGRSSSQYPVDSITSVVWLTSNLGTVISDRPYSSGLIAGVSGAGGYSMAKITYVTKAHEFRVLGRLDVDPVQIVIED